MKGAKRIIPISSGKGGVGKTTFAINFALSLARHGRTVLVDLDMGTSSVRNVIDTPVERDLYHFFRKGTPLSGCITPLGDHLDPTGAHSNFGFIAAPRDVIDDVTNMDQKRRDALIDAINGLDATYVILDLKAGLDPNVIEFLPLSNSGILIFTPQLTAATLAASQVVKAMLFRKLRAIFGRDSDALAQLAGLTAGGVRELIDRAEDAYHPRTMNLDGLVDALREKLGDTPLVRLVAQTIHFFRVHFVLNMFSGVEESYETAVKPFADNLLRNVSGRLSIMNLGWIVAHPDLHRGNTQRRPALLRKEKGRYDPSLELARLARRYLGSRSQATRVLDKPNPAQYLNVQLETLRRMSDDLKDAGYRENYKYIAYRSLHLMSSLRVSDFGDSRLFKPSEMRDALARRPR